MRTAIATAFCLMLTNLAAAEDVRLVLWNGEELFTVAEVIEREAELRQFAQDTAPDILLLDEVCSLAVVEKVREVMDLDG